MSLDKDLRKKIRHRINDTIDDLPPRYGDWAKNIFFKNLNLKLYHLF
jgi:hypothetical protein